MKLKSIISLRGDETRLSCVLKSHNIKTIHIISLYYRNEANNSSSPPVGPTST